MNEALRNAGINWIFLQQLPIQDHYSSSITSKRQNQIKKKSNNRPEIPEDLILWRRPADQEARPCREPLIYQAPQTN